MVTEHKPVLVVLFSPTKGMPALAANYLAQWAPTLSQYDTCIYTIKYQKTMNHGNAEAVSCLSSCDHTNFNGEEQEANVCTVCIMHVIGQ